MPAPDPTTLSAAERADAACDSFEKAWRAGQRPSVEEYVAAVPEADRDAVRSALVKVEAELRSGRGTGETSGGAALDRTSSRRESPVPTDTADPDAVPAHVGRFEVRAVLGAGAFGRVYRAFDPTLDREVAIKVPQPGTLKTDADRDRFLREARAAATVSHPNVCQIFEVGTHAGQPYIVMAMVPGQSLQEALRGRAEPLPERQTAIIVRKIALALDAAHKKGVIHRDLKPANVMFDRERKDFVVMDFGLARRSESGDVRATQSGAFMGTPAYMSPEQARGEARDAGPATDIFSLGVMLYEMLAGERPFQGGSVAEVMGRIVLMEPQPPSELRPGLDPLLEAACLKALAKDPAQRFASMGEFASALDGFLLRPVSPGAETVRPTATRRDDGGSVTESQHLGNVFARMTADADEDVVVSASRTAQSVAPPKRPRWLFAVAGAALGLAVFAVAAVVFFTRGDTVKASVELTDIDLTDKSLKFSLNDKPITAEELSKPMELKPNEYLLEARRDGAVVKRYSLTVTGGRNPAIKARDITPKPEVVVAPPRSVPPMAEPKPNDPQPAPKVPAADDGFVPLFNGKDLTGWVVPSEHKGKDWIVNANGELFGEGNPTGGQASLATIRNDFRNFRIRIRIKNTDGNTKQLSLRRTEKDGVKSAYVVAFGGTKTSLNTHVTVGSISKDTGQGLAPVVSSATPVTIAIDQWYTLEVSIVDSRIVTSIDGEKVAEYMDSRMPIVSGHIRIVTRGMTSVCFRSIEIAELPPSGFVPLFNGKDLTGWDGLPGMWALKDGALVGTSVPALSKPTYLYSKTLYTDFELKFEVRLKNGIGNSGVQIRSAVTGAEDCVVAGPQVDIAATEYGGLFAEGGGGWMKRVPDATIRKVFKPNDFNSYLIRAVGKRVVIVVNGTTLVDDQFPAMPDRGVVAFQFHVGQLQPDELTFRNAQIRDLSAPKPK